MKYQPNRDYKSDDVVMTPPNLAKTLIEHFNPIGYGLEPCRGTGNIWAQLKNADWCEITDGRNFYEYNNRVDYIFTNPPWSQIRKFLQHSYTITDNVYILCTVNHLWTKSRLRDMKKAGFGIKEICIFDTPKEFPQSGFQCGMIHICKGYKGKIKLYELDEQ